ncbi:vomeronasal type-2 receptor 26-like [Bufo gargarizans]|uniref:vomeronasal type-2 receptor 26-like n=1 Tax=Bufo gargarizans TaxID=30331 RepID=UPI001CF1CFB8|nr:vomeronasal type-2 receptor 26-like [Bufo gargarizans]
MYLSFYGFLRPGEFSVSSQKSTFLKRKQLSWNQDHLVLSLPSTKTSQTGPPSRIRFFKSGNAWCPVVVLQGLINSTPSPNPEAPLLPCQGKPLSTPQFVSYIRSLVAGLGVDPKTISGHSFRIGAASAASKHGTPPHVLRHMAKTEFTPESTCSKSCLLGYQRIPMKGQHKCCYSCDTCPEGQISNATDMEKCMTCPKDKFSNQERTACIPRATEFLSHGDALGISLIVISLLFCFLTAVILGIFVKYKDTAIVKANNRNLSFILLLSLMLSFLCPLLFIGRPSKLSCLLRQVAFGNIFTVAVSSVLAKTVTVVLAFRATKPDRTIRKWLWKNLATSLLLVSSFGEFVICVLWLIISPPFPEHNTQVAFDKIILQCNEGSSIAFYIVFVYIGFLAMLSFIVAFLARRLPDTFNEAQYITFSMLVFCSVWISFIPAYLSTKGKYTVAVEVFAISSSSAGLLSCIFIPKCYIILLKPELNIKSKLIFVVK